MKCQSPNASFLTNCQNRTFKFHDIDFANCLAWLKTICSLSKILSSLETILIAWWNIFFSCIYQFIPVFTVKRDIKEDNNEIIWPLVNNHRKCFGSQ